MNYYLMVLKKYAVFSGRATRSEYWYFALFNTIIYIVFMLLTTWVDQMIFSILHLIYMLAVLIPGIAVSVRRLHDTGRSGWMIFISLIPFVGGIWLLVLTVLDSGPDNKYGPNPKGNAGNATPTPPPAAPAQ